MDGEDWPQRSSRILGRTPHPGHSIRPATLDGKPHLLHSDESIINPTAKGCLPELPTPVGGASQPYLTDISDATAPKVRGQVRLPINEPDRCLHPTASRSNASGHHNAVDDPDDTTFPMLPTRHPRPTL